ncbi:MAG: NAD(P)-dependent oxidoreductase [Pseudomonadota bacterium]
MSDRIVVAQPIDADIVEGLSRLGPVRMNPGPEPFSPGALAEACAGAEALMAFMTERIDAPFLDACPRLRIVAGAFKGFDNVDLAACAERGVTATIVPDLLTAPTAELALGLMIAVARNIGPGDRQVRSGGFHGWRPRHFGGSLDGATVGVIGAGRVGRALLRLLAGFDCTRLYHDKRLLSAEEATALAVRHAEPSELIAEADFTVLAVPLTPETTGMVDTAFLSAMKPGSYLVNVARGSLVVEAAVAAALESGQLAGFASDVFEMEDWARADRPAAVHPALLASERTVFTPHLGSAVIRVRREIARSAADSIVQALSGQQPETGITAAAR